jgi:type III restriction enzyme
MEVAKGGVTAKATSVAEERANYAAAVLPDVLAYLQNATELTRSTLVRILKESGRLPELFADPQRFLDAIATILRRVLHRLIIDGIKYDRMESGGPEAEWQMVLFENEELVSYLSSLEVKKSVYEYVVFDSEVEREFARRLDEREDIKLFVKLPRWFQVDTPIGSYNPDWAILKHDGKALYLVRETKGTKDFLKLRSSEADKVRCGAQHFQTLNVDFKVAVSADEV